MKMLFCIPIQFMKRNKGQTISILLSMILSVTMIVSVSCLMHSARVNQTESDRKQYGDYHYYLMCDDKLAESIMGKKRTDKYSLQNVQKMELKDSVKITDTFDVVLAYGDKNCRDMMKREIIEGKYPVAEDEIAMDRYTLRSLGAEESLGEKIAVGEYRFVLSGITREPSDSGKNVSEAFVSEKYQNHLHGNLVYLKFNEKKDMYRQVTGFVNTFGIEETSLKSNGVLIGDVIDGNIERIVNTVMTTRADKEANLTTLLMRLRETCHMTSGLVTGILALFSVFIIYSIFHISTSKRLKEYAVLQTIGVGRNLICAMLVIELLLLLLVGYPVGVCLAVFIDRMLFHKISALFSGSVSLVENIHSGVAFDRETVVADIGCEQFYIDWQAVLSCAVFMAILLIILSILLSGKINKKTVLDMMQGEKTRLCTGRIYSTRNRSLLGVLTNRFMFHHPKRLVGIIFSLSLGGVLILSTNAIALNSRMNNEMVMHSADSLSSDIKLSVGKEEALSVGISEKQLQEIKNLPGLTSVSGFRYCLGELSITGEQLKWKKFWPEIAGESGWNQTPDIMSRFHGIAEQTEDGYKIKTNIYGYDKKSLSVLRDYVLDGSIDSEKMERENGVILRTLVDAQNNTDGLAVKAGDTISIKTLKDLGADKELLRFQGEESLYQEKEFKVLAVVSGSLVNNTEYIGSEGLDIIMTNEQMEEMYQLDCYNMLMIDKEKEGDSETLFRLREIISDQSHISIVDNSLSIRSKNAEIKRAEVLLYSIAVLWMVIALFHIINTIFHLLEAQRYSFAVLRAMGITEGDFYRMLIKQGFKYAALTCVAILAVYMGIVQKIIASTLCHVYGYINTIQGASVGMELLVFGSVVVIFVASVGIASRQILRLDMVGELKR